MGTLWNDKYIGIEKYVIHPTNSYDGRLQFNENLWGPSPKCLEILKTITNNDLSYYDLEEHDFLKEKIAELNNISRESVFLNAGSSEVLKSIFSVILEKGDTVLVPSPGWGCYRGMIEAKLCKVIDYRVFDDGDEYHHDIEDILQKSKNYNPRIIIITSPQMPTGNRIEESDLVDVVKQNKDKLIIVDECYYGCTEMNLDVSRLISDYNNIVFVRTMSKIYGLANLRVGYGIADKGLVDLVDYVLPLHKLPNVIRKMAMAAIEDVEYTKKNKQEIIEARRMLINELNRRRGVKAYNSYANFVYVKIESNKAKAIKEYMEKNGISVRLFEEESENEKHYYMRITVAPKDVMNHMLELFDIAMEKN